MENKTLRNVGTIKLNSYRPLCRDIMGQRAIRDKDKGFPAFIDGSCRREPDFENLYPSISALCRRGIFAPHLKKGDIVVYVTVKGIYPNDFTKEAHHRLIAILQVKEVFQTHKLAENWFLENDLILPSNCMVENNPPKLFEETSGNYLKRGDMVKFLERPLDVQRKIGEKKVEAWNNEYQTTSEKWSNFVITEPIFLELANPPIVLEQDWINIMEKVPLTRTPCKLTPEYLIKLAIIGNINLKIE